MRNSIAVVVGNNYSTLLGVVKSLGEKKIEVHAVLLSKDQDLDVIVKKCRYITSVEIITEKNESKIISRLIEKYSGFESKPVIFTTGDYFASLVDRNYDQLSSYFYLPHACNCNGLKEGTITHLMNKSLQNKIANELGIQTAKEWIVRLNVGGDSIPSDIEFPCFIKTSVSFEGGKGEMVVCNSYEELNQILSHFKKRNPNRDILVQEFIDIRDEYIITGVSFNQKIIIPALSKRIKVAKHSTGLTVCGEIIDLSVLGDEKDKFINLLKQFNYTGLFGMDIFVSKDGKLIFNEMNFRSTGVINAVTKAGANLPLFLYDYFVTGNSEPTYDMDYHSVFFNDKVAWNEYKFNAISKKELKYFEKQSTLFTLKDDHDSAPYKAFIGLMKKKIFLSRLKRSILGIFIK